MSEEAAKAVQRLERWVGHWVMPVSTPWWGPVGKVVRAAYPYLAVDHQVDQVLHDPNELTIIPAPPESREVETVLEYLEAPLTYLGFLRENPRPDDPGHIHFSRSRPSGRGERFAPQRLRGRSDIRTWSSSVPVDPEMFNEMQQLCFANQMREPSAGQAH